MIWINAKKNKPTEFLTILMYVIDFEMEKSKVHTGFYSEGDYFFIIPPEEYRGIHLVKYPFKVLAWSLISNDGLDELHTKELKNYKKKVT